MGERNQERYPRRKRPTHTSPILSADYPTLLFVTACVKERRPLLANDQAHALLRQVWLIFDFWLVGRYVVMPDHVHFFCAPARLESSFRGWMECWRNAFTRDWARTDEKPIWQRDVWDTQLRRGESYFAKWQYVQSNPIRRGLVAASEDWPYQGEMNMLMWTGD